jgi:hypothetical protein
MTQSDDTASTIGSGEVVDRDGLWKEKTSAQFSGEAMHMCGHCCGLKISLRAAGIIGVAMSAVKHVPRAIRL